MRLSANSWARAELDFLEETDGNLFLGYYRVWTEGAGMARVYAWDGITGVSRRMS
ncbi:MAG TPA: hypothetical protein VGG40_12880 [Solirubrobacterales bacterium]